MSGVLDFLFEGQPPPSVTTYGQTVQNLPQWYTDYTQGLVSRANEIASVPYQTYQGPRVAGFTDPQNQAFQSIEGMQGAYKPNLDTATGLATNAATTGALTTATPYLNAASGTLPQNVSNYMNPYVSNVIDRAGTLAGRQWNEQILPSLQQTFAGAGQYGSSRMREVADRDSRDLAEGLQSQSQAALSQAYQTAGNQFQADASREGQLAATAGNLATNQTGQNLDAAKTIGSLSQIQQNLGLQGSSALADVGQQQQQLNQTNLTTAYQDFLNQVNYPKSQEDWLSAIIRGQQIPTSTTTTSNGPLPGSQYQPSGLSQILGGIGSIQDIYNSYTSGR